MLTQDNLFLLAYEEDFRSEFLELDKYFKALDDLGGKNCKSCNKNRQRLLIRDMSNLIIRDKLTSKYQEYYSSKVSSGGLYASTPQQQPGHNTNYAKLPLSLDQFISCLLFSEVRDLLGEKLKNKAKELLWEISMQGVYSTQVKLKAELVYPFIFSDGLFGDFSALLKKLGIMEKVRSTPNSLKVKILESSLALEDEINRFILGKNIVSIQKDRSSALITYR